MPTNHAVAVDRIANIALDFTAAQQTANVAYDMTIEATGDCAQASDDYKAVMTAYHSQSSRRVVMTSVNTTDKTLTTVDPAWLTQSDIERIWNEAQPEAY